MDPIQKWAAAYKAMRNKIKTFARGSYRQLPGYSQEDLEQELLIVLWECVQHYDPNRGARFNTFFQQSMRNRIISLVRRSNTKSRTAIIVYLAEEAVQSAVDELTAIDDVEEQVLHRLRIQEYVERHGPGIVLNGPGAEAAHVGKRKAAPNT